jgi:hypothetical protein
MLIELLAFAVVAVALATLFVVLLMGGQKTLVGVLTVCAALIAASALVQAADAQQFQRPLPNDPERFRMIEDCVEMTFGRSAGKEPMLYQACIDELERASRQGFVADRSLATKGGGLNVK